MVMGILDLNWPVTRGIKKQSCQQLRFDGWLCRAMLRMLPTKGALSLCHAMWMPGFSSRTCLILTL